MCYEEKNIFKYHIPRNKKELKVVNNILLAQKEFDKKLKKLDLAIENLFKKYIDYEQINNEPILYIDWLKSEIQNQIKNLFAKELTATGWTYGELKNWKYPHFVNGRKFGCEICGDNRVVDRCHIVPNRMGAGLSLDNMFTLCPTHHRLLDEGMLSKEEFSKLNISDKSADAKKYFKRVIEPNMIIFWKTQKTANFKNELKFCKEIEKNLIKCLKNSDGFYLHELTKKFTSYHKEIFYILNRLVKDNVVTEKNHFYKFNIKK